MVHSRDEKKGRGWQEVQMSQPRYQKKVQGLVARGQGWSEVKTGQHREKIKGVQRSN